MKTTHAVHAPKALYDTKTMHTANELDTHLTRCTSEKTHYSCGNYPGAII